MNKFTKEEMIKKHETNVKSALSGFALAGVLALIYIVRYFIKGDFGFYFSFAFSEVLLRLQDSGKLSPVIAYVLIGIFVAICIACILLVRKDSKNLKFCLGFYLFDTAFLIVNALVCFGGKIAPDFFIDVIIHAFIIVFLIVGVKSAKVLKSE